MIINKTQLFLFFICFMTKQDIYSQNFKQSQLRYARVKETYAEKFDSLKAELSEAGIHTRNLNIFIRAVKLEEILEVWVKNDTDDKYRLFKSYPFCMSSGELGPKRKEGDMQIPEGFYYIRHFNPVSTFYLSLGLNYPNSSDRILGDQYSPGSAIYIHGACATIGCIPITDDKIKELYVLAVEARNNGQERIPVHIFPAHMNTKHFSVIKCAHETSSELNSFWKNIEQGYHYFDSLHILPEYMINNRGKCVFNFE